MKKIFLILNLCVFLNATEWEIHAGNFYYSPSVLEVNVGDNVTWLNDGGFHDVNATVNAVTGFVYDNPEVFIIPPTSNSVIGNYTFNIPGTYNYNCSVGNHASQGQTGIIIVLESSITGCMDPNAITCNDDIDSLYFPECDTCSDDVPCDNYYNPNATIDNGLCMYNDIPAYDEFSIDLDYCEEGSLGLDWSSFSPPVEVSQYVLMRCADIDGDNDNDGEFEYEMCVMIIPPMPMFTGSQFTDDFADAVEYSLADVAAIKYTLSIGYPNNNYWGSAFGNYYYEPGENEMLLGDLNFDGILNVIDVVSLVNGILGVGFSDEQFPVADMNCDGIINVIDIVSLVNSILG